MRQKAAAFAGAEQSFNRAAMAAVAADL